MKDYTGHIENLEMLANYGEFSVWNKDNKDRILKAASAIRELQELESMHRTVIADKAERIEQYQEKVKEYDNAIRKFLKGDYPHPRSYRPDQCPHDKYYYEDCGECDGAYWESEQSRIKAMGDKS